MKKRGLASALADGIAKAKGNVVAWMDCDLGLPPEHLPKLVEQLDKYHVAIGSRYVKGGKDTRPPFRSFLSTALNFYASAMLSFKVRDYTSGFAAVRREVFDKVKLSTEGFGEYFAEFMYDCLKRGFKIKEVGYVYRTRLTGKSKSDSHLIKYGMDYGIKVIKLKLGL